MFLVTLHLFVTLQATEIALLVGAIAPFIVVPTTSVQLPFALLAIHGLVPTYFAADPTLSLERSIALNGSQVYLFLSGTPLAPAFREPLYLRDAVAQPFKIGT